MRISACDPPNLVGILTPGPRLPSVPGKSTVYRDGVSVAVMDIGATRMNCRA